jgi:hypothetical protein
MDQSSIERRRRRGTALALAALAGLALLLAWSASGSRPDPMALAQEGATSTSTWTPRPPFTSPLSTPVLTATAPPRPTPQPLRYITNPTEAYVLGQRYDHGQAPGGGQGAIPSDPSSASGEAVVQGSLFLPLVLTHGDWLWYKGAGKAHGYRPSGFMSQLGGSWWYDWQHDYTWGDYGNFAYKQFVPMVWCADLPGEPGVPRASPGDSDQGKGHWNPQELTAKVAQNRGRVWLIFNEPDFPPGDYGANYAFQQCAQRLCQIANYATLAPPVTMTPGVTPTATSTFTPTPTPRPGATATPTPTPKWPCSWPKASDPPVYLEELTAKMIRMAADRYAQIYRLIKATDPTAGVFCCGNFYGEYDTGWWQKFLEQLRLHHRDVKIDGVAMHAYPWSASISDCALYQDQPTIWRNCLQGALEEFRARHIEELQRPDTPLAPDAPIWITEIGYLFDRWVPPGQPPPTPLTSAQVTQYLMQLMVEWLQGGGTGYEAVAWFVSINKLEDPNNLPLVRTMLFEYVPPPTSPSVLTTPGAYWASTDPMPAIAD